MSRLNPSRQESPLVPDPTPYDRALASRSIDPLMDGPAMSLVSALRPGSEDDHVSLEIAALHLVIHRLLTEQHDLPSLATHLSRVVAVAIQAARARQSLSGKGAEDLLAAVATIVDELFTQQ